LDDDQLDRQRHPRREKVERHDRGHDDRARREGVDRPRRSQEEKSRREDDRPRRSQGERSRREKTDRSTAEENSL
jgi:hypothetical protein